MANLTVYIFGRKPDVHKRVSALQTIYKESPTSSRKDMSLGPHTASNWRKVFTHPLYIVHSTSLSGFADDQQTELNQTSPNTGR